MNPRKLGMDIHGCRVMGVDAFLPAWRPGELVLCAVGAPGAREDIRQCLSSSGLAEPDDFLFVA